MSICIVHSLKYYFLLQFYVINCLQLSSKQSTMHWMRIYSYISSSILFRNIYNFCRYTTLTLKGSEVSAWKNTNIGAKMVFLSLRWLRQAWLSLSFGFTDSHKMKPKRLKTWHWRAMCWSQTENIFQFCCCAAIQFN